MSRSGVRQSKLASGGLAAVLAPSGCPAGRAGCRRRRQSDSARSPPFGFPRSGTGRVVLGRTAYLPPAVVTKASQDTGYPSSMRRVTNA